MAAEYEGENQYGHGERLSSARAMLAPGVLLVLILAVGYGVAHHTDGSQRIQPTSDVPSPAGFATKAKPSPGIPWGTKHQDAAPRPITPIPADGDASATSITTVEAATAESPVRPLKPRETEGAFAAKHQKSFGRGCDGRLALTAKGIDFACESGSEPELHVGVDEIKGASGNGIELKTGEKYHFDLQRSKSEE